MFKGPWHVLQVTANHEKKVAQHLSVREVENYLPLYSERSRWTDRIVSLERPLFTGYVFVHFSPQQSLSVISAPGVIRLLGNGQAYTVGCDELERIRVGLASGCVLRAHPGLAVGKLVRVRSGVFEGIRGVVAELRHRTKVIIELSGIKQSFSLEVDQGDLDLISGTGLLTTAGR